MKIKTNKLALTKIVVGLLIIFGGLLFLYFKANDQFDELSLIRHGQTVPGHITNCTEQTDADGFPYHSCDYTFTLSDGRTFDAQSAVLPGKPDNELTNQANPYPATIQYLIDNPKVSKIKNTGSTNLLEWAWQTLGLVIILLIIFAFSGFLILAEGIKEFIKK